MHTKLIFLLFSFWLLSGSINGQDPRQYSFAHYGANEGLASNEGRAVLHDDEGFVWVGTNNGLQRYDGFRFLTFKHDRNNPNSLPHNFIVQLLKDNEKNIWVLSGEGHVSILDTRRFEFKSVPIHFKSANAFMATKKLVKDDKGHIFLVAGNLEYLTWNKESGEFNQENNFFQLPGDRRIIDIAQQPGTSKYWLTTNLGIVIYNSRTGNYSYAGHNLENEAIIEKSDGTSAYNLFFDRNNRLWYDVWGPGYPFVNCFDLSKKSNILYHYHFIEQLKTYYETNGYMQQEDGTIWIRGLGILAQYLEKENRFQMVYNGYINEQSIVYEGVSSFCEDRNNNIWVTTTNNGLYRFAPAEQYFTNIRHLHPKTKLPGKGSLLSFVQMPDGDILTGAWGDGLYRYDASLNLVKLNMPGLKDDATPSIWDMKLNKDSSKIWMGIQPGIGEYDLRKKSFRWHHPPAMKNRTVRQIAEDRFGNLWLGTEGLGVFKWDAQKGKSSFNEGIKAIKDLPETAIGKIFVDSKGLVWVASVGNGIFVFDPKTDDLLLKLPAIDSTGKQTALSRVVHILEYDDTTMVLSGGSGLHIFNRITKSIRTVGNEGTTAGVIASVEKDEKSGYLWVSTTQGLYRVNIFRRIFVQFDRIDGITDDRFVTAASLKLPDGRMLFGADNQFTAFQPSDVRINNNAPPITITGFRVLDRQLLVDSLLQLKRIELNPKQNSLTIDFSGLIYNGAYLIQYKMEGLDNDWRIADKSSQAVYNYLPPGDYTFQVKSQNAEGKDAPLITTLTIKIYPNFWQTWWFYGLLLLLAAGILYWIDQGRIRRLNELQRVRSEIANNLHADVTTTLSNINLLGEMAKIKADKDIDRSKEYIDQISTKSHDMIIAMDDILWSIDPENDSMDKTLLRMMEYTDALRNRYAANIELSVDKKLQSLKLSMMTRHEFFLIFKEGLRLIVQHAGGSHTLVQIDLFRQKLSLKIQDISARLDQNIDEIEATIQHINERTTALGGESDIQYDKNGIAIVVMVPAK